MQAQKMMSSFIKKSPILFLKALPCESFEELECLQTIAYHELAVLQAYGLSI